MTALLFLSIGKGFSQSCVSLNCAASHTGVTTDGTLATQPTPFAGGCFDPLIDTYKQIFWEFFYFLKPVFF